MLVLIGMLACGDAPPKCEFPLTAVPPNGVLDSADDCGSWRVIAGDHLYANVTVTDEHALCTATLDPGLTLNADPIFSALGDQGPQFTYDIVTDATPGDAMLAVDIACDEGSYWRAQVQIVAE
jgi:hypothetical protein